MKVTYRRDRNDPNYIHGNYGLCSFKARVLEEPVNEGIANGRVTELKIYNGAQEISRYDKGTYKGLFLLSLYKPIVERLEKIKSKNKLEAKNFSFITVGGLTMNEPTIFLLTTIGIGMATVILEKIAEEKNSPAYESIHRFKSIYIRYGVPISVVACGMYVFVKLAKLLI